MWTRSLLVVGSLALAVTACSGDDGQDDDVVARDAGVAPRDAGASTRDAGTSTNRDGGASADGGERDGGTERDGGVSLVGLDDRPANPGCLAPPPPSTGRVQIRLTPVYQSAGSFSRPIFATQAPGDSSRWYVVEQAGRVRVFDDTPNPGQATTAIDLRSIVDDGPNEAGLLSMAFHPDFATNRYVYLSYTTGSPLTSRVVRYTADATGATFDASTDFEIFSVRQPFGNHNGGMIAFGQDGHLYLALGDGGSGGDPNGNGQNINTVLGAILRFDVDGGSPYAIPPTNPFAQTQGADEIFAWGLRNPWRFSFDRVTGELWAGDVGQGRLEEVDLIELGGNYGWNIREGDTCYNSNNCDTAGLIDPVAVYGRSEGVSITGGYVYRGTNIPGLVGVYLYADFSSGRLWGLFEDPNTGDREPDVLLNTGLNVASFAEGNDGEVYVVAFDGTLRRIELDGNPPMDAFPTLLSETGCVDASDPKLPAAGLIPYDVNAPLWSDGAAKQRWMALPDGETVTVGADGDFDFPNRTVLMKRFELNGRLVETRLFMRHMDGQWAGYTYAWNDAQTDATLLESSRRVDVAGTSWRIPSRGECMACHSSAAGRSLGLEIAQLNRVLAYPSTGRTANQLATLSAIGVLADPIADVTALPAFFEYDDDTAPVADRTRGYLHSNCANCHQAGGPAQGMLRLRYDTALADSGMCDEPTAGSFGITDARVVAPGSPARSVLSYRMHTLEAPRMPRIGSEVVDPVGTALVDAWITGLGSCP